MTGTTNNSNTKAETMLQLPKTPNYDLAVTTVKGLKDACKFAGLKSSGNKLSLVHELSEAWSIDSSLWDGHPIYQETAYCCWYADTDHRS